MLVALAPSAAAQCVVYFCAEPDPTGSGLETWSACVPTPGVGGCTSRGVGEGGWSACEARPGETRYTYVYVRAAHVAVIAGLYERCDSGPWDSWDVHVNHADGNNDVHQAGVFWYASEDICRMRYYAYRHPILPDNWGPTSTCPAGAPPVLP